MTENEEVVLRNGKPLRRKSALVLSGTHPISAGEDQQFVGAVAVDVPGPDRAMTLKILPTIRLFMGAKVAQDNSARKLVGGDFLEVADGLGSRRGQEQR